MPDALSIPMPSGAMRPACYVIMQHVERRNRPVKAYQRWISQIPGVYRSEVLRDKASVAISDPDPNCVGYIKNYQSLMPLAEDARKPIFRLTPADGAIEPMRAYRSAISILSGWPATSWASVASMRRRKPGGGRIGARVARCFPTPLTPALPAMRTTLVESRHDKKDWRRPIRAYAHRWFFQYCEINRSVLLSRL